MGSLSVFRLFAAIHLFSFSHHIRQALIMTALPYVQRSFARDCIDSFIHFHAAQSSRREREEHAQILTPVKGEEALAHLRTSS